MSLDAKSSAIEVSGVDLEHVGENTVRTRKSADIHDAEDRQSTSSAGADFEHFGRGDQQPEYVDGHAVIKNGADISRHIVSTRDDGDPAFTFRSIVIGTIFTALSSTITMLYRFKPNVEIQVSFVFLQLLVYLFGEAWARFTPQPERFPSKWLQQILRFINFGQPFQIKEHVVAALIASSGNNGLSGIEVFAVERLFYDRAVSATTAVLATFSISLCGFVLAGVLRPLIVYPAEMVYWSTMPQISLFQTLHLDRKANRDRLIKFGWAVLAAGVWELFPAYIVTWFSGISIFCLASMNAPTKTREIFGNVFGGASANEGLGLLNIGLDWQYIQSSCVSYPLKQQINIWIGYAVWYIVMLALFYGNVWNAKSDGLPFMSTSLFLPNGTQYSTTAIIDHEKGTIDYAKVQEQGLPRLTSSTAWGFLTQNLAIGALISHVLIFYGKDMMTAWKQARSRTQPDPHYQAMLKYKEVPYWWYWVTFLLCFFAGLIVILKGETTLSVGGYFVALLLGAFIAPFSCILYGLYGTGVSTNQISKMVAGAMLPGRPLANLYFASWSHQVILLAVNLANWLKVGQYTKIPPRVMFWTQIYASLLGAAFNYVIMTVIVTNQRELLLSAEGNNVWSGSYMQSLNSQAITWALAKDVYGTASSYLIIPLGLVIGLGIPPLHWAVQKLIPRIKDWPLNTTIIVSYAGQYYYGNTSWLWSSIAVGVFSQVWLRRRKPKIFNRYNYLIGAALDGGSQIVIFILSFAVYGAAGNPRPFPSWWGTPQNGNPDHCL